MGKRWWSAACPWPELRNVYVAKPVIRNPTGNVGIENRKRGLYAEPSGFHCPDIMSWNLYEEKDAAAIEPEETGIGLAHMGVAQTR